MNWIVPSILTYLIIGVMLALIFIFVGERMKPSPAWSRLVVSALVVITWPMVVMVCVGIGMAMFLLSEAG